MLHPPLYVLLVAVGVVLLWGAWKYLARWRSNTRNIHSDQGTRESLRIPVLCKVAIGTRGGIRPGVTRNISQGGMFVQMDPPLELRQTYPMTIEVSGSRTIQVEGRVVWSISGGNSDSGAICGIGVLFTDISEEGLAWIMTLENLSDEIAA